MKNLIDQLHKAFESRIRLGIMAALAANDFVDYNSLKELLKVTDGNLASHLKALEKEQFISINKSFIGRKPHTNYSITPSGKKAFEGHLNALEVLIKQNK